MKRSHCIQQKYLHFLLALGLWSVTTLILAGSCTVSSGGMAFGTYQPLTLEGKWLSTSKTSSATVSVVCTSIAVGGSYTLSLGPSNYGSGNRIATRYLNNNANGGDLMVFNVFTDPSHTAIWGGSGSLLSGTIGHGDSNQSHTVYGQVPAGQNTLKAGNFSDSLLMTLRYEP